MFKLYLNTVLIDILTNTGYNTDNMGKLSSLRQGYGWHSCHGFCPAEAGQALHIAGPSGGIARKT